MPSTSENVIWYYTPSNTRPEELEALLVEREPILEELLESVRLAADGKGLRHFLLVGPRGAGKTHVISVLRHRIDSDPDMRRKVVIGWLPEDMFGMSQPVNWFRTLAEELGQRGEIPELLESLAGLTTTEDRTAESVGRLIASHLGDRTLIILHENLNRVLKQLGRRGQQVIRAFLQNNPNILLIATTPSLSDDVQKHEAPFYGFFQTRTLDELTYDGTLDLFIRLARLRGDEETVAYLDTPIGKGRVRSVQVLAGSNPRILIVFGGFMSREGFQSLLPLFEKTVDEMTPYYQERMESLSPQQQEVLLHFLKAGRALTPTNVAELSWLSLKLAGTILANLTDLGFLRRRQDGKKSWYDLREPLMKMAWQVKDSRTEPIELIVDFVRVWFTPSEVEDLSRLLEPNSPLLKTLLKALELGIKLDIPPMEGAYEIESDVYLHYNQMSAEDRVIACERLVGQKGESVSTTDLIMLMMAYWYANRKESLGSMGKYGERVLPAFEEIGVRAAFNLSRTGSPNYIRSAMQDCLKINVGQFRARVLEALFRGTIEINSAKKLSLVVSELKKGSESETENEQLAIAFVKASSSLLRTEIPQEQAERWFSVCKKSFSNLDIFRMPLRLIDAMIKYKADPSEIHLLQLPQQVRPILSSLLPANIPSTKGRKARKR